MATTAPFLTAPPTSCRDSSGGQGFFFNGQTEPPPALDPDIWPEDIDDPSSQIELGDPPQLQFTNAFTIEGWIRPMTPTNRTYCGTRADLLPRLSRAIRLPRPGRPVLAGARSDGRSNALRPAFPHCRRPCRHPGGRRVDHQQPGPARRRLQRRLVAHRGRLRQTVHQCRRSFEWRRTSSRSPPTPCGST